MMDINDDFMENMADSMMKAHTNAKREARKKVRGKMKKTCASCADYNQKKKECRSKAVIKVFNDFDNTIEPYHYCNKWRAR